MTFLADHKSLYVLHRFISYIVKEDETSILANKKTSIVDLFLRTLCLFVVCEGNNLTQGIICFLGLIYNTCWTTLLSARLLYRIEIGETEHFYLPMAKTTGRKPRQRLLRCLDFNSTLSQFKINLEHTSFCIFLCMACRAVFLVRRTNI